MKRRILITCLTLCLGGAASQAQDTGSLSSLTERVRQAGKSFPQEKVFVHMDNNCYFAGDTLWYKAYVTRTDARRPTDLSRILYVELLTPDGYLLERQQIPLENDTTGYGNFVLNDSIYGGFYELRAYTRWMLNFGRLEAEKIPQEFGYQNYFFNVDAMKDFFVDYEKLYSRVFPVYDKPVVAGQYLKDMTMRPMMRYYKSENRKPELELAFFPEGGQLVTGVRSRVAFELTDEQGQRLETDIRIQDDRGQTVAQGRPTFQGRGSVWITPEADRHYTAQLTYQGESYSFPLPEAVANGCVLQVSRQGNRLCLQLQGSPDMAQRTLGVHLQHQGMLLREQVVTLDNKGAQTLSFDTGELPTGVQQITVFDEKGRIYAERLAFLNHGEYQKNPLQITGTKEVYEPYEPIVMQLQLQGTSAPAHLSLAIRDAAGMEKSYDNGNMLTELLLSSELKGFIDNPAYYFEADDSVHRAAADLLMLVQGWRRYKWQELAGVKPFELNYLPEKYQTLSGRLYRDYGDNRNFSYDRRKILKEYIDMKRKDPEQAEKFLARKYPTISRPAVVHADYVQDTLIVETEQVTQNGYFYMTTPRMFGQTILFLSATDSVSEEHQSKPKGFKRWLTNKLAATNGFASEKAYPEFYVKRDLFFPNSCHPYNFYQDNSPEDSFDPISIPGLENNVYHLPAITVRTRKGGLRKIDRSKPALVVDAYEGFNKALDMGLVTDPVYYKDTLEASVAMLNRFPLAYTGDYGTNTMPRITLEFNGRSKSMNWGGHATLESYQYLKNTQWYKIYTDFCPRERGNMKYEGGNTPEIRMDVRQYDGKQRMTYRDRYIVVDGFAECDAFYSPDYSKKPLPQTPDYRRTLYWNPDIRMAPNGKQEIRCYNNSKKTRISVEAEGLTQDGTVLSRQIGKK